MKIAFSINQSIGTASFGGGRLFLVIFAAVVLGILVAPVAPAIASLLWKLLVIAGLISGGFWLWARFFSYQAPAPVAAVDDTREFLSDRWTVRR